MSYDGFAGENQPNTKTFDSFTEPPKQAAENYPKLGALWADGTEATATFPSMALVAPLLASGSSLAIFIESASGSFGRNL